MNQLSTTEEVEIFNTKVGAEVIEFTWLSFGKDLHLLGGVLNMLYVLIYTVYINQVFLGRDYYYRIALLRVLSCCLFYPLTYESF